MLNTQHLQKQKGLSLLSILIYAAFIFAALNVYAYFNPSFSLSKYSPVFFVKNKKDETRKADLGRLQDALERYYEENGNKYPGVKGSCGRIVSVLHSQVDDDLRPYFSTNQFPGDPSFGGTNKDYFFTKLKGSGERYVLMAVLEVPPEISEEEKENYNFGSCYDWPGDDVYNYRVDGPEH